MSSPVSVSPRSSTVLGSGGVGPVDAYTKAQSDARYIHIAPGTAAVQNCQGSLHFSSTNPGLGDELVIQNSLAAGTPGITIVNNTADRTAYILSTGSGFGNDSVYYGAIGRIGYESDRNAAGEVGMRFYTTQNAAAALPRMAIDIARGATDVANNIRYFGGVPGSAADNNFQGGEGLHKDLNVSVVPTAAPPAGAFRYASGGACVAWGSGNTITTYAPA